MERLLETFENTFTDAEGELYDVQLRGTSRPGDTWQGSIVFVRRRDGETFATDTETTQPSAEAVLYWATGLSATYFEGAFARAQRPLHRVETARHTPPPLRDGAAGPETYLLRLTALEQEVLGCFGRAKTTQLSTQDVFRQLPHAHADVVRALEDLEKRQQLLTRRTEAGNDWLLLTENGLRAAGVESVPHTHEVASLEPPKR